MAKTHKWLRLFESFIADIRIVSKEVVSTDPRGAPLVLWESQKRFINEVGTGLDNDIHEFYVLKSRQLGVCLHPDTRVLKADLTWSRIEDLHIGNEVVAVDEYAVGGKGNHRHMRTAIVEGSIKVFHKAYRITFDDGRSVICTKEHPWLVRGPSNSNTAWCSIKPRRFVKKLPNDPIRLRVGVQVRWITKPWGEPSVEDGWFGGMLDGEGSISNENRTGTALMVCQKRGLVFDRLLKYVQDNGFNANIESDLTFRESKFGKDPCPKIVFSRQDEIFKVLGQTRPTRFIGNHFWENRELPGKKSGIGWATVISIEELPEQYMIDLQTSTGTYIAEGFVSHNTTVSLAIDVFWLAMHDNIIAALVTDNEANREANRALITKYVSSFDDGYFGGGFRIVNSNREMMIFSNGATIRFLVAGTKRKSIAWAEGTGYSMIHATEVAKYADENAKGLQSLLEGFAQTNPNRLLIMESTSNGFNHWKTRWEAGGANYLTQRSFFIGWWSGDTNRIERSDPRFLVHSRFPPSKEERDKIAAVKKLYNWDISLEQLTWLRWKESAAGREQDLLQQNQPYTAGDAFVEAGYSFFQTRVINKDLKQIFDAAKPGADPSRYIYKGYMYNVVDDFFSFSMEKLDPKPENRELIELRVWEEPQPTGRYVVGFDVAYGRNDHKDGNVITVWRCFADRMVQVAEYATYGADVRYASWVFFHLCAAYGDIMGNIEIAGPGRLVMAEFEHLRELLGAEHNQAKVKAREWEDANSQARWYLYHKPDSLGAGYVYNFETNWSTKPQLMHNFRSCYVTKEVEVKSVGLLKEMLQVRVDDDGGIGVPDSSNIDCKDDRVFAAALAAKAWTDWVRKDMLAQGRTYEHELKEEIEPTPQFAKNVNSVVYRWLARQKDLENQEPPRGPEWMIERGLV